MPARRKPVLLLAAGLLLAGTAAWAQREFRVLEGFEAQANYTELPADWREPADFVIARLMYPSDGWGWGRGRNRGRGGDWRNGGTTWAVDYPRGDRYYASILRRLTTIDVRSVEQPVNLEDGDDVYNWPFLIVGLPGTWNLTEEMTHKLRDYLERGGFLLCDSFWGSQQWEGFKEGLSRVFPDRPIEILPDDHPLFHSVYDLTERQQIPNMNSLLGGGGGYFDDGDAPLWAGILDDNGRVMVAIAFNNDISDSFQWADDPDYPADSATLGLRLGVNFAVYALTH